MGARSVSLVDDPVSLASRFLWSITPLLDSDKSHVREKAQVFIREFAEAGGVLDMDLSEIQRQAGPRDSSGAPSLDTSMGGS